jgi:predicted transcriptional regulator
MVIIDSGGEATRGVFWSMSELASRLGRTERTLNKHIRQAISEGWLIRVEATATDGSNQTGHLYSLPANKLNHGLDERVFDSPTVMRFRA